MVIGGSSWSKSPTINNGNSWGIPVCPLVLLRLCYGIDGPNLWKIHLFNMVIFHSKLLKFQRVTTSSWGMTTERDKINDNAGLDPKKNLDILRHNLTYCHMISSRKSDWSVINTNVWGSGTWVDTDLICRRFGRCHLPTGIFDAGAGRLIYIETPKKGPVL